MDRRDFIKIGAVGAAVVTAFPEALAAIPGKKNKLPKDSFVREPSRDIPVVASYDVLVAGGGPSGVAAAICAAREGASVLLVERYAFLGGLWTAPAPGPNVCRASLTSCVAACSIWACA